MADAVADMAVAVHDDRHLVLHAHTRDVGAVLLAARADVQRGVVDFYHLAALVAAADDVLVVEIEVRVAQMAERIDIRVVENGLERRRVDALVRRREQAFMEGRERPVDVLQALVRHDVDAAGRGGNVELNAADNGHAVYLARNEVQVGKMPLMRSVRVCRTVVCDGDCLKLCDHCSKCL